ncbi:MAG: hypothetical protein HRT89_06245 [Lentisphaeria bacterium]|nr:hypothetical protein [Lentisphaeria bacterium]NQZ67652.1 hypothetical protein [Lentisphaeria bacterium]
MEELAGAACHELNQPLQVITGYAELLLMQLKDDDEKYSKIKILKEQADKLAELTKKLNGITKYETQNYINDRIIDIDKSSDNGEMEETREQFGEVSKILTKMKSS